MKIRNYLNESDDKGNAESLEKMRQTIHRNYGKFENKLRRSFVDKSDMKKVNKHIDKSNNLLINMINKVRGEKNAN